jgi:O-antigen ligase
LYRKLYYLYFVLAVVCIVLTGSRTSFVALLFLCSLWVFFQQGARKFKILAVVIPMIFIVWSVMPQEKQNRIRTLWDEEAGPANATESAKGRLEGWNVSWRMFKQVPLTGVGAGGENFIGYRIAHNIDEEGHVSATQSHVLYGQVLAEQGILGALLFCGLVASIARCSFVVRQEVAIAMGKSEFYYLLSNAILASLLLLLVLGFGGHNFYRPLWLWLAAWSGALLMIVRKNNQQAELEQFDVKRGPDA